ncbi:DUF1257 domain-containing protein [Phormidium sp. CCY1219]|uniref:DUF1257 domain-containing protein n=1 Tax=Phormidium sp. CCY1219 TaxID=2886104 RepID=UPI002D1EFA2C|nr:DUF1257 domain-containing protein [Phormidium sp. CCY1219]MEB3827725.1 DUF1257 domain-containing protein [Phormidium sp. CCY1219]
MSHFTTIKVQIKQGEILQECLQELGYCVERDRKVRGYGGKTTKADYVIKQPNGYDIGFRRQANRYELVADLWGARINAEELVNAIGQKYAYKTLMTSVQEQGFSVETEETLEDGTMRVVVGRWM